MMSERVLVDAIFKTALGGTEGNTKERSRALWLAGTTLLADVLLCSDPFTRERLLRGLIAELRETADHLSQLLAKSADKLN